MADAGANLNAQHHLGGTALIESATSGSLDVVKSLVTLGADVALPDFDGVSAVMSAASQGHTSIVK